MARVGVMHLWQEVNTYSPRPTTLAQFEARELAAGDEIVRRHQGSRSVIAGFLSVSSLEHVPLVAAGAWPGAPPGRGTADELLARIDFALAAAPDLDGVLIDFHGAMVCEGHPDMELDVVRTVRAHIGDRPVAAVVDLHAIPSPDSVRLCDVLIGYDTYPHVDMWERGQEAAGLMEAMLHDGQRLCSGVAKLPMLTTPIAQATDAEPMRTLKEEAAAVAARAGLRRVSLLPGFPYSDVERAGFSVVGVADEERRSSMEAALDEIAAVVEGRSGEFAYSGQSVGTAVAEACQSERTPVVLVDIADNVGGGGAGDGTALLAELLRRSAQGALVTIADAEVASRAFQLGPGATISAELGAKCDDLHGEPVQIEGRVLETSDGSYESRGSHFTGLRFGMGRTALIQVNGVRVAVTERAVPPFHAEQLTSLGVELEQARIITAKGAIAWRAAFGELAGSVIEVDTPGVTPLDPSRLPRTTTPMRVAAAGAAR